MLKPSEVASEYVGIAQGKVSMRWYKTLVLAVLAGAFIAFGGAASTFASAEMTGATSRLVKGAVFPVGLMLVVICGAELFTGNCLLLAPTLSREVKPMATLKNLGLAYLGNLVGSILIAVLVVFSHVMPEAVGIAAVNTANAKCAMTFGDALLRGILCNMLVCLAVWAAMSSKSVPGKILAVYLPVFTFVACGFEHSIANMYYLSAGLMESAITPFSGASLNLGNSLVYCLIPSTIGNIIGGAAIAAAMFAVHKFKKKDE